ncbi:hypothetical protein GCM10007916_33570 [Psychromonas marina]|uniref:Dicarboxylate transport domain-containing protein n=1 Tax=Psychromonas marina TaxID=88364 RepID=A0ABQ6E4A0_9GAMM|nr:YdbH domain-containing protein [Psychromonas marina]GLS92287.1 hypothetical protein GCM10007916_33570 [Psychromonas marina]
MINTGKGVAFFIVFLVVLLSSYSVQSNSNTGSIQSLAWLPLLSANMKSLQPDKGCPQNKINDLQVSKAGNLINSRIGLLNWDLDCTSGEVSKASAPTNPKETDKQLTQLLKQFSMLPNFELQLDSIRLFSKHLKSMFSASLAIKNNDSNLSVIVNSDLFSGELKFDFKSKVLTLDATVNVSKLPYYIQFSATQSRHLSGKLIVHYQSSLKQWQKGQFNLEWKGLAQDLSETTSLSIDGDLDLANTQLTLSNLALNAQQVALPISDKKVWKVGYIKLKNSGPIMFDYSTSEVVSLPVDIRIGSSHILTSVERGKSKRIRIDKQKLPPLLMQLDAENDGSNLQVDWVITLLSQKLRGSLLLSEAVANLQITKNSINLKQLSDASKNYLDALALVEIETGEVIIDLSAQYNRRHALLSVESRLISDDISGKKELLLFDGVKLNSHLHYRIDASHKVTIIEDTQRLDINNLFVGIPIQALTVDAQLNAGQPIVHHFKARLLGGRLDLDDFKLIAPSQTILNLSGISLPEVIKYSAYPEIESKAIVDGMLPLKLTEAGIEINDGIIFARAPGGYIKVPENTVIKAMGRGNPAFSFTMQLLSNFQFDTMQGRIGYTDDGESDLDIEIKGISPTVSGTQPVNFNYSHKENILKLLQSLRFNEQLVRDIKERY